MRGGAPCAGADIAKGKKAERVPRVRWYDARVRTALRRVASWLNVPWPAVGNFEHLLAYQVLLPAQPGDPKKQGTAWEQGLWAAKVGATTVGIGALFAVTGAFRILFTSMATHTFSTLPACYLCMTRIR